MKQLPILIGCAWLLATPTTGQDLQAEYFFDTDPGPGNGIPLAVPTGPSPSAHATLDISAMSAGVHKWYVRTKQNGVWGFYGQNRLFYLWEPPVGGPPTAADIDAAEYFFDADPGPGNGTSLAITPGPAPNISATIDVAGLSTGVHLWYVRTRQNGVWGFYGERRLLYLWEPPTGGPPVAADIEAAEYFFDVDPGPGNGIDLPIAPGPAPLVNATLYVTGLTEGVHKWYIRTKQNGAWGFYGQNRVFFLWTPDAGIAMDIEAAEYFIDTDPGVGNGTPIAITPGPAPFDSLLIDITGLSTGMHTWNVRVKQNGTWGLYGEQRTFTVCDPPDPAGITFTPSSSCTNGTFTVDVDLPASWAGDPYRVFNNVDDLVDTLEAGESATYGPYQTGTELLFTAGSSLDPNACTVQFRALLSCWYEDADSDGFGDPLVSVVAVDQPTGYVADDSDNCPTDPNKIDPGVCGCGVADIATTWYEDADGDDLGDPNVSQPGYTCIQPPGYVEDNSDNCPLVSGIVGDACDDGDIGTISDSLTVACTCAGIPVPVEVSVRLHLEGPYDAATGLMDDELRSLPDFPLMDPYPTLGYLHTGGDNDEPLSPATLATTGSDAIVDWVLVELRDANDNTLVVASRSALVQRDGDVVEPDGFSPLLIDVPSTNYHVAVRHRNHLGCMTAAPVALDPFGTLVDLTSSGTATYGIEARRMITGAVPAPVLWAGDTFFNGDIKYTGADNDRDPILQAIGGVVPTSMVTGYLNTDVDLDGRVLYTGSGNDRDPILQNIGGVVPTNTRFEQLP